VVNDNLASSESAINKVKPPIPKGTIDSIETVSEVSETFIDAFGKIVVRNITNIPELLKKNAVWLVPLIALWLFLMTFPTFRISILPGILRFLMNLLIFLTASYNNFIAKIIYVFSFNSALIPAIEKIRKKEAAELVDKYKRTFDTIRRAFLSLKNKGIIILLSSSGTGLIIANFLSRNNRLDKYFVCLLSSFALINALSEGAGNVLIKLFRLASIDLNNLFKKDSKLNYNFIYTVFAGLSLGLAGEIIPGLTFRMFGSLKDYTGYVLGLVLIVISVVLHFLKAQNVTKEH